MGEPESLGCPRGQNWKAGWSKDWAISQRVLADPQPGPRNPGGDGVLCGCGGFPLPFFPGPESFFLQSLCRAWVSQSWPGAFRADLPLLLSGGLLAPPDGSGTFVLSWIAFRGLLGPAHPAHPFW